MLTASSTNDYPSVWSDSEDGTDEDDADKLHKVINELFETGPLPRDVLRGAWMACKCVVGSCFLGVATLFAGPIVGYQENGARGVVFGLGSGLLSMFLFGLRGSLMGAYVGTVGLFRTPRAIVGALRGEVWDEQRSLWKEYDYSLQREFATLPKENPDTDRYNRSPDVLQQVTVKDEALYDLLEVPSNATSSDIRKAYFRLSLKWHPDKCPRGVDVTEYNAKFQAVSEAYQTLSDPVKRRRYDASGTKDQENPYVDAQVFFNVLFGCAKLEPLIGKLQLSQMFELGIDLGTDDGDDNSGLLEGFARQLAGVDDAESLLGQRQARREVLLAMYLAEKLDVEDCDAATEFLEQHARDAQALRVDEPIAQHFIDEISYVYCNQALVHLAGKGPWYQWPQAWRYRFDAWARTWNRRFHTGKAAVTGALNVIPDDLGNADTICRAVVGTLWGLTKMDIHTTLTHVCQKLLTDTGVSSELRLRRARRLFLLGRCLSGNVDNQDEHCRHGGGLNDGSSDSRRNNASAPPDPDASHTERLLGAIASAVR